MKFILSLLLCLCFGLPVQASANQPRAFTATVFPVWLILQEVTRGVPNVNVGLLLPPAGSPAGG